MDGIKEEADRFSWMDLFLVSIPLLQFSTDQVVINPPHMILKPWSLKHTTTVTLESSQVSKFERERSTNHLRDTFLR